MIYHKVKCQSGMHKLKRKIPYGWDLNVYKGCEHGCKYCYAMYTHNHLEDGSFSRAIYIKENIVDVLETELSKPSWSREVVNLGGVTDSYQPIEAEEKIMTQVLKLLIKYKTPCIISTKSDLVLRDYDLIDELSKITYVNIAASITTVDEDIRKLIEPKAVTTLKRFDMLKEFSNTRASIGLHLMPIIPYITDNMDNMEEICALAQASNVSYLLPGMMYLKGATRPAFFDFIKKNMPQHESALKALYIRGGADKSYKDKFYKDFKLLRESYGISSSYSTPMKAKMHKEEVAVQQLSLFDL